MTVSPTTTALEAASTLLAETEAAAAEIRSVTAPRGWRTYPAWIGLGRHKTSPRTAHVEKHEYGAKLGVLAGEDGFTYSVWGGITYESRDQACEELAMAIDKQVIVCSECQHIREPARRKSLFCQPCEEEFERKLRQTPAVHMTDAEADALFKRFHAPSARLFS